MALQTSHVILTFAHLMCLFLIFIIFDLYVFNIVYNVGIKQYSSEMALQTSHVILTFAHLMCLFLMLLLLGVGFGNGITGNTE
jgi:hypothetical protein